MQTMMKIMPLFNLMTIAFPSGIGLYWFSRNLWTIGQQHFVLAKYYEENPAAAGPATRPAQAAPPTPNSGNGGAPRAVSRPNPSTSKKKQQRRKR